MVCVAEKPLARFMLRLAQIIILVQRTISVQTGSNLINL